MTVYDLGEVIGPKGDPGAKGDPGKSIEITEATVEYTEGESSVEVNKSESDDKDEYTFTFHLKTPEGTGGTSLPDGGTIGQVLTKMSDENGDADWQTVAGLVLEINWDKVHFHIEDDGNLYVDMDMSDPSLQNINFSLSDQGELILTTTRKEQ